MFISKEDSKFIHNSMMYQVELISKALQNPEKFVKDFDKKVDGKSDIDEKIKLTIMFLNFLMKKYSEIAEFFEEEKDLDIDTTRIDKMLAFIRSEADVCKDSGALDISKDEAEYGPFKYKIEEKYLIDNFNKIIKILMIGSQN